MSIGWYGRETWPFNLREEQKPSVFWEQGAEDICGPKMEKAIGGWRKLHNEEFHDT